MFELGYILTCMVRIFSLVLFLYLDLTEAKVFVHMLNWNKFLILLADVYFLSLTTLKIYQKALKGVISKQLNSLIKINKEEFIKNNYKRACF